MRPIQILASLLFLVIISFSISGFNKSDGPPPIPPKEKTPEELEELAFIQSYQKYFEKEMIACNCPGAAISIVKDSAILLERGFGFKSVKSYDKIGKNSAFRVGSLSKGFASVLTGIMIEKGFVNWNDPVKQHMPSFRLHSADQSSRVRIHHLLSHTSGLPIHAYTNLVEDGKSIKTIANELVKVPLLGKEGKIYAYQNATFSIIEEVIQSATGSKFENLLNKELFEPLGMTQSSANYSLMKSNEDKALPHLFRGKSKTFRETRITKKYYNSISSGGVNSSISDMSKWMKLLLGQHPEIIQMKTLDQVFTPFVSTSHARRYFNYWDGVTSSHYAMGWRILKYHSNTIAYHGGYVNGYRSEIAIDRDNGIGICAFFNGSCSYAKKIVPDFLEKYREHQIKLKSIAKEAATVERS